VNSQELELRDVRGPSALGGGMRRAGELLYLMASFEFRRAYFGTVLGYVWSICRPLLLFAVLLAVFTRLVRFSNVPHYPELLLLNVVLFGFFQEATNLAVPSIVSQEGVVRKTQFPRLVIPLSVVLTAAFNLGPNLLVAFILILALGVAPMWSWLLLVVLMILLLVFTVAVAMIVSSLYPRFRDVGIIWAVLSTVLFYATPIIYPLERLHGTLGRLLALNPLAPIFELVRRWVITPTAPVTGGALQIAVPIAIYLIVCALAAWVFNREAPRIAEEL
jgi:ABC-2 type transport system permease protein